MADAARKPRHPEATKRRAREMRTAGATYEQIGAELGCSVGTLYYWLNPKYAASVKRSSADWKERNPEKVEEVRKAYEARARGTRRVASRKRYRKMSAAMRVVEAEREGKRLSSYGTGASEAYSLVRKALQALDGSDVSGEARVYVNEALQRLHEAEDAVGDAVRAGA